MVPDVQSSNLVSCKILELLKAAVLCNYSNLKVQDICECDEGTKGLLKVVDSKMF